MKPEKRMKKINAETNRKNIFLGIATLTLFLDQLTKYLVIHTIPIHTSYDVFPSFSFTYTTNTGISFGMFKDFSLMWTIVPILVVVYILWIFYHEKHPRIIEIALALIMGGALGNLLDRLIHGFVVDFIDIHIWPIFNIADSAISIAAVLLLIAWIREKPNPKQNRD